MESTYVGDFPHANWTEIDDEAWKKLLEDMNPAAVALDPLRDQGLSFEDPVTLEYGESMCDRTTRHNLNTDAANRTDCPSSPPGCAAQLSADTSPEAEPAARAASGSNDESTVEDLRRLTDQLQRE